mmetsp:Transcript_85920/g.243725  ORF Transcript_85920/g.243725 Transcript_85920/m.243725 type:complete len:295 (-) Transcript_85920:1335-2219(-)
MLRVVRVQDRLDAALPHFLELLARQAGEDVALRHVHDLEQPAAVHVLERGLVVVAHGELVRGLDQEDVVEAGVGDVVARGAHQQREPLAAAEVRPRAAELHQVEEAVRDVDRVEPVVVGARPEVVGLRGLQEVAHGHRVGGDPVALGPQEERRGGAVADLVELQRVEVPGVEEAGREPSALQHGDLHGERGALRIALALVLRAVDPAGAALRAALAPEAVDHGTVALGEPRHRFGVDDRLGHHDITQHRQLLHDSLQNVCLITKNRGRVFLGRILAIVGLRKRFVLHLESHFRH